MATDYTEVPDVTTGDTWTADNQDTYVRNNFKAVFEEVSANEYVKMNSTGKYFEGTGLVLPTGKVRFENKGSPQSIAPSTDTVITFDTEVIDTNAFIDLGASTSRITIPAGHGGNYLVIGHVHFDSASGTKMIKICINGVQIHEDILMYSSNAQHLGLSAVIVLTAGQYLTLVVQHSHTSNIGVPTASLSAVKIG